MSNASIPSKVRMLYRRQLWALFGLIVFTAVLDAILGYETLVSKGVAVGGLLCFMMQACFTAISYQKSKRLGEQMMKNVAMALLVKWGIGIVGFALIFKATTLFAPAVFAGFVAMQAVMAASLYHFGK